MNKLHVIFLLGLIIFFAFIIRAYNIHDNPPGFFADEASIGYNAYMLAKTGEDEHGESFPIFFQSFGDYRHPVAVYSAIPFILLFGLSEFSIRLQGVFFGLITILMLYLLGKEVLSEKFGIWTAFVAAVMPWLFHYNRTGFEFSSYPALFVTSLYLFIIATKNKRYIIPSFLSFALTIYTYQPAKLIIPLFAIGLCILYRKHLLLHTKESSIGVLVFFLMCIPLIINLSSGEGFARFNQVSIFSSGLPLVNLIKLSLSNYAVQLSPLYFFVSGEKTFITRHFTEGLLPLLITTAPFLLLGIFWMIKNIKKDFSKLLLLWIAVYPLSGALVQDGPFTSRSLIGAPLCAILISLGIVTFLNFTKRIAKEKRVTLGISAAVASLILINFVSFMQFYFIKYPLYSADFWGWQYGAKHIINTFTKYESEYDTLVMAPEFNSPDIFFKFYAPEGCSKCTVGLPETHYNPSQKQLFAVTQTYLQKSPYRLKTKKIIFYPDGNVAFLIGEIVE